MKNDLIFYSHVYRLYNHIVESLVLLRYRNCSNLHIELEPMLIVKTIITCLTDIFHPIPTITKQFTVFLL